MKQVTAREVRALQQRGEPHELINVLPEEHYRERHIPGSVSIPLESESFLTRVEHIVGRKDSDVIVYCADADCNASLKAGEALEGAGYRNVRDFAGGLAEWTAEGLPLEGQG